MIGGLNSREMIDSKSGKSKVELWNINNVTPPEHVNKHDIA